MVELPTGTVTFLFTDIEGSTSLWEQYRDAMRHVLVRHDALVEQIVAEHAGYLVRPRGEGDSRFAVFARATDAVAAAAALQQALYAEPWPTPMPLRVRIAIHTGEADLREGDYYGSTVNRCARLRAVAHGGQTLISLATQELARDNLPTHMVLQDLGAHRLKDLVRPEQVFQLVVSGLPADFPPLKSLDALSHNLPPQRDPLIGREREVAAVMELLRRPSVGLVTMTGPGGVGKTRLSLQVAAELLEAFPDGAWFVDLAPISDPVLVPATIAQVLEVKEVADQPLLTTLKSWLAPKHLLLVLDNFEQVLPAATGIMELLRATPRSKVLVTSREVLRLSGEYPYPVSPLALPDLSRHEPLEQLTQYASVALFIQWAQVVKPDFQITNESVPAVAEICVRLDGLPLAIELAAARVRMFPPQALLARLDQRLKLLTGGARDRTGRQQTLRGAIDWSYHLLVPTEQQLFVRLAVFVGGWTLDAAEAVCLAEADADLDIVESTQSLLDKSLLRQEGDTDEPRFTMLETIREYALERLQGSGKDPALRQRHSIYYLHMAEAAEPELRGPQQRIWLDKLEVEHNNLRAALNWGQTDGDIQLGLRLVGALSRFWLLRGYWTEWEQWLRAILPDEDDSPPAHSAFRAKAVLGWSIRALHIGDLPRQAALASESLALYRRLGDTRGIATALYVLGAAGGDDAQAYLEESLALAREVGDAWLTAAVAMHVHDGEAQQQTIALARRAGDPALLAMALWHQGFAALWAGDVRQAALLHEESLALRRVLEDKWGIANSLLGVGEVARWQGDYARAWVLTEERLRLEQELGNQYGVTHAMAVLGTLALAQGDIVQARSLLEAALRLELSFENDDNVSRWLMELGRVAVAEGNARQAQTDLNESLRIVWKRSDMEGLAACLAAESGLAVMREQSVRAARLLGAAEAVRALSGVGIWLPDRAHDDQSVAWLHARLDEQTFAAAWAEGQAMTLEQAVAYALEEVPDG